MSSNSAVTSTASDLSPWSLYFDARPTSDSVFFDEQSYISRLQLLSLQLFATTVDVEIIESESGDDKSSKVQIGNEASLSTQLRTVSSPALRIMYVSNLKTHADAGLT
jgi:hypothetical protein